MNTAEIIALIALIPSALTCAGGFSLGLMAASDGTVDADREARGDASRHDHYRGPLRWIYDRAKHRSRRNAVTNEQRVRARAKR